MCICARLHQKRHRHNFRDDVRSLYVVPLHERLRKRSHQSSVLVQRKCRWRSQLYKALDRLGTAVTARAMSLVLPTAKSLSHDRHAMRGVRRKAQATDMTTNQDLSSSGCGAIAQESQVKASTCSLSTAEPSAAESIRSSKLLPFGNHKLPAIGRHQSAGTQQLQLFLNINAKVRTQNLSHNRMMIEIIIRSSQQTQKKRKSEKNFRKILKGELCIWCHMEKKMDKLKKSLKVWNDRQKKNWKMIKTSTNFGFRKTQQTQRKIYKITWNFNSKARHMQRSLSNQNLLATSLDSIFIDNLLKNRGLKHKSIEISGRD